MNDSTQPSNPGEAQRTVKHRRVAPPLDRNAVAVQTIGETMLRFTPPAFERFGQSPSVEMHVGGSESNTVVGLARLGHRVRWISRMTDNPLGRWVVGEIASHGVDVSHVVWTDKDRVGTYYMERGRPPRDSQVFYDRAASALSRLRADELPPELFASGSARILHVTGITLGISQTAAKTISQAVEWAKSSGQKISFDLNYRSRLWPPSTAYATCAPIMDAADFIFLPQRDAVSVCGLPEGLSAEKICHELHQRWPQATILLTLGSSGAAAVDPEGRFYRQAAFPAVEVERLGGGDAFSAGYLSAFLEGMDVANCLAWAAAAAALKYTLPGDLPLFDREMLVQLVEQVGTQSPNIRR